MKDNKRTNKICVFTSVVFSMILILESAADSPKDSSKRTFRENVGVNKLIQPRDLVYEGAFRLPRQGPEGEGWEWGGTAATFYPDGDPTGDNDGYPGSLFITGHNWHQKVSEISIPRPVRSRDLDDLNAARTLQDFRDIRQEVFSRTFEITRGALQYLPAQGDQTEGKIYYAWSQHLEEEETGPSHGWFSTDLSRPDPAGPWRVGGLWKYVTTDYMFEIPKGYADEYLNGMTLATGRFRDGGQGAQGPSIIAIAPWQHGDPPEKAATIPARPVLLYGSVYEDMKLSRAMNEYHDSDAWSGGAWLTKEDRSAVIFVGMKGIGDCWYGYADGVAWFKRGQDQAEGGQQEGEGERGWWSTRWQATILFYDPGDLVKVAAGEIKSWEPQPYAKLAIHDTLFNPATHEIREVGSVAYDRERGKIYIIEYLGDLETERPIVHVFAIK